MADEAIFFYGLGRFNLTSLEGELEVFGELVPPGLEHFDALCGGEGGLWGTLPRFDPLGGSDWADGVFAEGLGWIQLQAMDVAAIGQTCQELSCG